MDKHSAHSIYKFDDFHLDAEHLILARAEKEISLAPKAVETLVALVRGNGEVMSKDELLAAVWPDAIVEESNLFAYLSHLRKALGNRKDGKPYVETLRRRGYRFNGDVALTAKAVHATPLRMVRPAAIQNPVGVQPIRLSTNSGRVVVLAEWVNEESHREEVETDKNIVETPELALAPSPPKNRRRTYFAAASLALLVLASLGFYFETSGPPAKGKTVAVLPFRPLVSGVQDESLEFGLAKTLIDKLNASGEIEVRPLSSVRRFTDPDQDSLAIGHTLGVDTILESYYQRADDRIRVHTLLIDTASGRQLWSDQFDRPFTGIFEVQNSISEQVATALHPQLTSNARTRLSKHGTENPEAYRLYLLGQHHVLRLLLPETQKGIAYLEKAIELDPNYALAYAELANAYRAQALGGNLRAIDVLPKSKAAALKALELDENLAAAHIAVANTASMFDLDWDKAERQAKRALELEPSNPSAIYLLGNLYSNLGRHDEAIEYGKRARELAPLTLIYNSVEAQTLLYAGRTDEALERALKTRELDDNFWHVHLTLARIYLQKGMYADAIAEADRAAQLSGDHSYDLAIKGHALARSGEAAAARGIIEILLKRTANARYHTNIAIVYTGLRENEKAVEHLERGFEDGELQHELRSSPGWNDLRSEPRFVELLRKLRLE